MSATGRVPLADGYLSVILESMFVNVPALRAVELIATENLEVVDVRAPHERGEGIIPGARSVSLEELRRTPEAALPRDGVVFVCAAGTRSQTAARLAVAHGLKKVYSLMGGTRGWVKSGLALEEPLPVAV